MKKILQVASFFLLMISAVRSQEKQVIYLWKGGAPGYENRKDEPEEAKEWWVKNVHNPSLTAFFPPAGKANGAAVIICPGGGHQALVYTAEGEDAANYFTSIGITAFVLKYRLFRGENSPYTQEQTMEDGRRAMRLVRKEASRWNLDTSRIGLMGFSAGGELAGWIAFDQPKEKLVKRDSIDEEKCRANFLVLVYPGPGVVPDTITPAAPPLFMIAANDDECCSGPVVRLLQLYRAAKVKSEVHLYAQGNHAFNMGKRSTLQSIHGWPQRLTDWLMDNTYLQKQASK